MSSNLESFCPKLRPGRVIPQGARIIFETDNPYNQIVLPMALADLILLCSGQFSVREIVEKVYKKQGSVPFRSMLTAIHLLHQGGFFENGDQLVLSSHLQTWVEPRQRSWSFSWRFLQRLSIARRQPMSYYTVTLLMLIMAMFGLQALPSYLVTFLRDFADVHSVGSALLQIAVCSSIVRSFRYLVLAGQHLLLTTKAYNFSVALSPWGVHLHVGDEANDLFENRLYTSMFHVSQILISWVAVLAGSYFLPMNWFESLVLVAMAYTFWELNPFISNEGRKLIQALMLPTDRDVVSWHFESNTLINLIDTESRRQDQDFARICALSGVLWLMASFMVLSLVAASFGPSVLSGAMTLSLSAIVPALAVLAWLGGLYYIVQSLVETLFVNAIRPYWATFVARIRSKVRGPSKEWAKGEILKILEPLPLFSHFHGGFLEKIINHSLVVGFDRGALIIQQGDFSRELFVLLEGDVEIVRRTDSTSVWISELGTGSVFGESALVDDTQRAAQVLAKTAATVLRVPIFIIRQVANEAQSVRQLEVFRNAIMVNQFFATSPVFRSLSVSSIEFLSSRGAIEHLAQNQTVFKQGDTGDHLYMILRGGVEVEVHGTPVKRLTQGSFFGEIALIGNIPRTASIRTTEPSIFFKISADAFWQVLVQHVDLGVFIETVSQTRLKEDLAVVVPLRPTGSDGR